MLEDRLRLVGRVPECRRLLGFGSRARFEQWSERLGQVRNGLAHGRTLLDVEHDPARALDLVHEVRSFAERVWDAVEAPPTEDPT